MTYLGNLAIVDTAFAGREAIDVTLPSMASVAGVTDVTIIIKYLTSLLYWGCLTGWLNFCTIVVKFHANYISTVI